MGNVGPTQARYDVLPVPAVTGNDAAAPKDESGVIAPARDRAAADIPREPGSENAPDQHD